MKTEVVAELNKIELADFRTRSAVEQDTARLITGNTRFVKPGGDPFLIYTRVDPALLMPLRSAVQSIKYELGRRTQGMVSRSRVFGYAPRIQRRNLACRMTTLARESPDPHRIVCDAARLAWQVYRQQHPQQADRHMKIALDNVLNQWRIGETPFTSGIVNNNNPLVYHFDTGNFKNVWSAMFVLKSGVAGGHLSVPELGVRLECSDCSLVLFDGQSLLHGVTPIQKLHPNSYRYSVVYYSLQNMWHCQTITDELLKMQDARTKIEKKRAGK